MVLDMLLIQMATKRASLPPEVSKPLNSGKYMGTAEVQEALGVPRSTISRWLKRGILPQPEDLLRATPVWRSKDIEKFKNEKN